MIACSIQLLQLLDRGTNNESPLSLRLFFTADANVDVEGFCADVHVLALPYVLFFRRAQENPAFITGYELKSRRSTKSPTFISDWMNVGLFHVCSHLRHGTKITNTNPDVDGWRGHGLPAFVKRIAASFAADFQHNNHHI